MPSSIDQPEDIQSELVKGVQLQDGSYNQMIADINGITVYDFSQIEPQIDTAIENNSAVKEVEIHQMTMRPATDEERKKVLDDSTRYYQEAA